MSRFDWQPDEVEGYTADAGDMVSLTVTPDNHSEAAEYLGGAVKWAVHDTCSDFYLDGHADNVEQGKRRAAAAYFMLYKDEDDHYQLRDFDSQAAAIATVEKIP